MNTPIQTVCTCICICKNACVDSCMCACMYGQMYACMHVRVPLCLYVSFCCVRVCVCAFVCVASAPRSIRRSRLLRRGPSSRVLPSSHMHDITRSRFYFGIPMKVLLPLSSSMMLLWSLVDPRRI